MSYSIDGRSVLVEEGLTWAVIDKTKHLLGPNTHLYFEAGEPSVTPERILGDKLRINVPASMARGDRQTTFTSLPGKSNLWVSYRETTEKTWAAYRGSVQLQEIGAVGGRLRVTFGELELVNSCGESRLLTDGSIDVKVGAEDIFPASEVDESAMSEWEMLGASQLIENNLILNLDGRVVACPYVDYGPKPLSAEESGTGREELVLELIAVCSCDHDGAEGTRSAPFTFAGYIPISGQGRVDVDGDQYSVYLFVDVAGTPLNFDDDEMWIPMGSPQVDYRAVGRVLGAAIDIELNAPLMLAYVDRTGPSWVLDTSRIRQLSYAHAYGVVNYR